ncbi:3554_t:CDS:2 [Paraglomus brasilianum]|uniref:3554_t:CDS:1 n=1 Tax=Paraglomus brasilianum TaxID=144538 RepID=A0A9N8ZLU4_9GLOM|nr:3554_t:CDS:2 [Paraglomus brasilianum]
MPKSDGEYNPYAYHRPHSLQWRGSVIPRVLPSAVLCLLVAVAVTCIHKLTSIKLSIPQSLIPILGFVVALLLTYRTNTAYDRQVLVFLYWEGRRLWSNLTIAVRNLARSVWISIKENGNTDEERNAIVVEKKTVINLLIGFALATKHYLREENPVDSKDVADVISNIETRLPGFEPLDEQDKASVHLHEGAKSNSWKKMLGKDRKPHERRKGDAAPVNHNLPLEILLYLASYFDEKFKEERISVPTANALGAGLAQLTECLTHFERILRSPIPVAYAIHLSQTVWIYCLSLPFQFVSLLGWANIPLVFLASFVLFGIEHIGGEIENPFGYDENDLNLDDFCALIRRELNIITSNKPPVPSEWIFTKKNHPFGADKVNAEEARRLSKEEVRSLLGPDEKKESEIKKNSIEIKIEEVDKKH